MRFLSLSASLQRMYFCLAAAASNSGKLIAFDDLDTKIFRQCLSTWPRECWKTILTNTYSTNHRYMLIDLLEDGFNNVAIFNVYFENQETKIYHHTDQDLYSIFYDGFDPFINNKAFRPLQ